MEEEKEFGAIDYDAPIESDKNTIGLGTKVRLDLFFFLLLFNFLNTCGFTFEREPLIVCISLIEVHYWIDWSRCGCCSFWLGLCSW